MFELFVVEFGAFIIFFVGFEVAIAEEFDEFNVLWGDGFDLWMLEDGGILEDGGVLSEFVDVGFEGVVGELLGLFENVHGSYGLTFIKDII